MAGMEYNYDYDSANIRGKLLDFAEQFKKATSLGTQVSLDTKPKQIVILGMGGSGIAGRMLQDYLRAEAPKIPVTLVQDFDIPEHALIDALVFVLSYSGNTEETLAAYRLIGRTNTPCVVVSTGGKIGKIAPMFSSHFVEISDSTLQPRMATAYLFVPMLNVLMKNGLIPNTSYRYEAVHEALKKDIYESYAKDLVEQIGGRTPIIYSGVKQASIAYKWKGALNETAKSFAFANVIPESTHNELECYTPSSGSLDDFAAVLIKDLKSDGRIQTMMDKYKSVIRKKGGTVFEVVIRSADPLSYLFTTVLLGEWVAYYMALAKKVDPVAIKSIEDFKKR